MNPAAEVWEKVKALMGAEMTPTTLNTWFDDAEAVARQNREEVLQRQMLEREHAPMLQDLRNRANTALGYICDENVPAPHSNDYASHLTFFTEVVTCLEAQSARA